ncbi:SirB2 family protein [Bibersteinia trehalosi]|uniref:SirB2 family protein n=1 Tax=Bibersteinia trehalosi TaxID=47735 RepID=UPI003D2BD276
MQTLYFSHIALAYLSLALLLVRGILSARMVDWRQYKLLKIAPHLVDTLLLISGGAFFFIAGYEFSTWLAAKLVFLVLYIIFAAKAFKKTQPFSLKHFILAVISFMMILVVATVR